MKRKPLWVEIMEESCPEAKQNKKRKHHFTDTGSFWTKGGWTEYWSCEYCGLPMPQIPKKKK